MDYAQMAQQQLANLQAQYAQIANLQKQFDGGGVPAPVGMQEDAFAQPVLFVGGGIDGARKVKMRPNTTIAVFDSADALFYLRSQDANGHETMKIGRFKLEDAPEPNSDVITRKDFEDFKKDIMSLFASGNAEKPKEGDE